MYQCFCKVSSVGHEGLWLLIIWFLGERMWGGVQQRLGEEREEESPSPPLPPPPAGRLKSGPQLPEDFATLPPGGQRGGLCPGLLQPPLRERGRKAHCQRRLEWTGQKEPGESTHGLGRLFLPSTPACSLCKSFFPPAGPMLAQTTSGPAWASPHLQPIFLPA